MVSERMMITIGAILCIVAILISLYYKSITVGLTQKQVEGYSLLIFVIILVQISSWIIISHFDNRVAKNLDRKS